MEFKTVIKMRIIFVMIHLFSYNVKCLEIMYDLPEIAQIIERTNGRDVTGICSFEHEIKSQLCDLVTDVMVSEEFLRPFFSVTDSEKIPVPDVFAEDPYQCARMPIPSENHQNPTYIMTFYCRDQEIESINKSTGIREKQRIPGRYLVGSPFPTVLYGFLRSSAYISRNKIEKLGRAFQIENVNLDNFIIRNEQLKESLEQQTQEIHMEEYVQRSVRVTSPYLRSNRAFSMEARSSYSTVSRTQLRNRRKKLRSAADDTGEYDSDTDCAHFRCWPRSK